MAENASLWLSSAEENCCARARRRPSTQALFRPSVARAVARNRAAWDPRPRCLGPSPLPHPRERGQAASLVAGARLALGGDGSDRRRRQRRRLLHLLGLFGLASRPFLTLRHVRSPLAQFFDRPAADRFDGR